MKLRVLMCAALVLAACDSAPSTDAATASNNPGQDSKKTTSKVPNQKEVNQEVKDGVKDVLNKRAPKWKVEYKGDLNGTVSGGIMSAVSVSSNTIIAGGAMAKDMKGAAKHKLRVMISNSSSDKPMGQLDVTLVDGTKCKEDIQSGKLGKVVIKDSERKTFKADLSGTLKCGDKKATYTAVLNMKP